MRTISSSVSSGTSCANHAISALITVWTNRCTSETESTTLIVPVDTNIAISSRISNIANSTCCASIPNQASLTLCRVRACIAGRTHQIARGANAVVHKVSGITKSAASSCISHCATGAGKVCKAKRARSTICRTRAFSALNAHCGAWSANERTRG